MVHLNLGCGRHDIKPASAGWVNCDATAHPGVDKVVDLTKPLPFADKYTGPSASGKVWISHSAGRRELETSDAELASVVMDLPEEVLRLKLRLRNVLEVIEMIVEAEEGLSKIEATRLERETVVDGLGVK